MIWKVKFDNRARKELRKLDQESQTRILSWLRERIAVDEDPRRLGKALKGRIKGLWRYRICDFRIICQIKDDEVMVLVVRIGHRRDVYRASSIHHRAELCDEVNDIVSKSSQKPSHRALPCDDLSSNKKKPKLSNQFGL